MPNPLSDANRLSIARPDIAKEWNFDRNVDTPDMFSFGSQKRKWWKCSKGHEWECKIGNRTSSRGCPACAGKTVTLSNSLLIMYPLIAAEWDTSVNSESVDTFSYGSNTVVGWKCEKGHTWNSSIGNRTVGGKGCPTCAGNLVSDANRLSIINPSVASEWDYDMNSTTPDLVSYGSSIEAHWKCSEGHRWISSVHNRRTRGCPSCAGKTVSDTNRLSIVAPDIAASWHPTLNSCTASEISYGSDKMAFWICTNGHTWEAIVRSRCAGNGCPTCAQLIGKTGTSMVEICLAAEFSFIFGDGTLDSTRHPKIIVENEHIVKTSAIDSQFATNFTSKGMRPDIVFKAIFSDDPTKLLIIEWDSSYWHHDRKTQDMAKTHILQSIGHVVIRMREAPLDCITSACISIDKTKYSSAESLKSAVNSVIRYIREKVPNSISKRFNRSMLEYLALSECQNQETARKFANSGLMT